MMTYNLANDFFKQFYSYKRPFQEVQGYTITHGEEFDTIFINALGVDPVDVVVDVRMEYPKSQILSITGKTEDVNSKEVYSVDFSFYVRKPIKKIVKAFRAGLLTLKVEYEEPTKPNVEIVEG